MAMMPDSPRFSVAPGSGRRIIRVTIHGGLTLDDVDQLATSQASLVKMLGYRPRTFDALIDCTASPIQSIVVADALCALSDRADFNPARIAFVHDDGPVKMQLRRVNADKNADFFATEEEALAWLSAEKETDR